MLNQQLAFAPLATTESLLDPGLVAAYRSTAAALLAGHAPIAMRAALGVPVVNSLARAKLLTERALGAAREERADRLDTLLLRGYAQAALAATVAALDQGEDALGLFYLMADYATTCRAHSMRPRTDAPDPALAAGYLRADIATLMVTVEAAPPNLDRARPLVAAYFEQRSH